MNANNEINLRERRSKFTWKRKLEVNEVNLKDHPLAEVWFQ